MKKASLFVAILLIAAVLVALGWAWWSDGRALRELDGLVKRAQAEEKLCTSTLAELQNPEFAVGPEINPAHLSRKGALAAIAFLEKMQSWTAANAAAADYYIDHAAELDRNWHGIEARALVAGIPGPCSILDSLRQYRAVLADISAYHLAPADARRARTVARKYLVAEPRFRSLMEGLVKYTILVYYLKTAPGHAALAPRAETASQEAERETQALMMEHRRHRYSWITLRGLDAERAVVAHIYGPYYALLRDADFLTGT